MAYAVRADVENRYGKENVKRWADVDNTNNAGDITTRINWALDQATTDLNALLRYGPYAIPFTPTYDGSIISMCAQLAGVLLYESRGITDFNQITGAPIHSLSWHRNEVMRNVKRILANQLRLAAASAYATYPQVVTE